jgi:hypothetical protein
MLTHSRSTNSLQLGTGAVGGFVAGYVMLLSGYWMEAVLGVSDLNLAHANLRYVSGGRQGWWIIGILFHFVDSVLLGLLYATFVYRRWARLTRSLGPFWGSVALGIGFGIAVWLFVAMLIGMPFMGSGPFAYKTGSPRPALASLAVHLVFGTLLGGIYRYRES